MNKADLKLTVKLMVNEIRELNFYLEALRKERKNLTQKVLDLEQKVFELVKEKSVYTVKNTTTGRDDE